MVRSGGMTSGFKQSIQITSPTFMAGMAIQATYASDCNKSSTDSEARRFHADKYNMKYLWLASKKQLQNQAFVSVHDNEISAWKLMVAHSVRSRIWMALS